jgi:hypothetical protein
MNPHFDPVPCPSKGGERGKHAGFTLIEVVLAIGLTAMVVYLLSTATELYLANVDASRTRVETAQLARTLLDQIANDLASARLAAPSAGGSGGGLGGQQVGGASGGQGMPTQGSGIVGSVTGGAIGGGTPGGGTLPMSGGGMGAPAQSQGVFGSAEQLRIDRSAYANWERFARELNPQEGASQADMPVTVRYFFVRDNRVTTQRLAQQGVAKPYSTAAAAGLYRESIPTAAIPPDDPPLLMRDAVRNGAEVELLAPEVVEFELLYFNGTDLVDEWDPVLDRGMPRGVEIRLTIAQPRFQSRPSQEEQQRLAEGRFFESELVEFRRYVRLPLVAASPPAQLLLPQGGQPGGGLQPGGPGQGGPGQGVPGGGGGGGGGAQTPGGGP